MTRKRAGKYDEGGAVIMNPGSGPVQGESSVSMALTNMAQFIKDVGAHYGEPCHLVTDESPPRDEGDGRFTFWVTIGDERHEIEMPGLPLDEVRYMRLEEQNIWDFPRLYVDGSSWVWYFAVRNVKNDPDQ